MKTILTLIALVITALTTGTADAQTLNINVYSQADSRWASDKMLPSTCTLGRYGCYATCLAAAYRVTPKTLNDYLSSHGGYSTDGILHPNVAAGYDGNSGLKYVGRGTLPATAASVGLGIGRGAVYVVESTRYTSHFVLVFKSSNGQCFYMDPADGTTRTVGDAYVKYGSGCRVYSF